MTQKLPASGTLRRGVAEPFGRFSVPCDVGAEHCTVRSLTVTLLQGYPGVGSSIRTVWKIDRLGGGHRTMLQWCCKVSEIAAGSRALRERRDMYRSRASRVMALVSGLALVLITTNVARTAEYKFGLLCSPPLFDDASTKEASIDDKNKEFCNRIRDKFQQEYGSKFGLWVDMSISVDREAFRMIITEAVTSTGRFDVWIGGAKYFHQLAREKGLTDRTEEIRQTRWTGSIAASVLRNARHEKLAFLFLDWFRDTGIDL